VPGPAANPASEPEMISVALLNRIPDVDRGNLREYWPVVEGRTKELWMQRLPRQAKPPLSDAGEVKIICWLHTDGRVTSMMLEQPSGNVALDRAAWAAITGSVPYDAFPYGISVNQVRVRFTFTYNQESGGSPVNGKPGLAGTKPRSLAK
jgi:TonB family protein